MALKDNAAIVAAQGFLFINSVGATAPTPDELEALDPETYGSQVQTITVTGSPTGGTFSVKNDVSDTEADVAYNATPAQLQAALESLESVGAGNVEVAGTNLSSGLTVKFVGALQGTSPAALTVDDSALTGGTSPAATATITTAANGWINIGHTSRDDMPEFGFDGGDTTVKGTWQKKRLREIATGDPVADSVTIKLEQFDETAFSLYFGENAGSTDGVFDVSGDFTPVEHSLLIIIVDGTTKVGFSAAKASFKRDDSVDMPVDDFTGFPVKATFLNLGSKPLYSWISKALFSAS